MYSIDGYGEMIADDARTAAYVRALRDAVKPGCVVLDIGTGTGFFAILACKLGARRVYAIESSDVIDVAKQIAADNRCAGAIEFIHRMSTGVSLPEPVDVIVSDLHGILPLFQGHLPSIIDARERFLKPGGTMIPARETLWVACVAAPDLHRYVTKPWTENDYGLDMRAARELQANQWRRARVEAGQMLTAPLCWAAIDYATVDSANFSARVALSATRAGTAHGFCLWFDAELGPGVQLSNSPAMPELLYASAFFPWPEAVALEPGATVTLDLNAQLISGEYLWTWETQVAHADAGHAPARFRQSD
ncbi:MAG: 50S ribosomal protein L11 methyltransferase, partial [Usitatibacter sp.]